MITGAGKCLDLTSNYIAIFNINDWIDMRVVTFWRKSERETTEFVS